MIAAIPVSRNARGITALIPGMSTGGDSGGNIGGSRRRRGHDPRRPRERFAHLWRRHQHRLGAAAAAAVANAGNTAGAQEVVVSTSGGLGEAETGGVVLNVIPREGSNTFSGSFVLTGANGAMQGSNYTQSLKDQGLEDAFRAHQRVRRSIRGRRPHHPRQALVLPHRTVQTRANNRCPACGSTRTPATRTPGRVDFDRASRPFPTGLDRNWDRRADVAGDAAQQDQPLLVGADNLQSTGRAAAPRTRRRKRSADRCSSRRTCSRPRGPRR